MNILQFIVKKSYSYMKLQNIKNFDQYDIQVRVYERIFFYIARGS